MAKITDKQKQFCEEYVRLRQKVGSKIAIAELFAKVSKVTER